MTRTIGTDRRSSYQQKQRTKYHRIFHSATSCTANLPITLLTNHSGSFTPYYPIGILYRDGTVNCTVPPLYSTRSTTIYYERYRAGGNKSLFIFYYGTVPYRNKSTQIYVSIEVRMRYEISVFLASACRIFAPVRYGTVP